MVPREGFNKLEDTFLKQQSEGMLQGQINLVNRDAVGRAKQALAGCPRTHHGKHCWGKVLWRTPAWCKVLRGDSSHPGHPTEVFQVKINITSLLLLSVERLSLLLRASLSMWDHLRVRQNSACSPELL